MKKLRLILFLLLTFFQKTIFAQNGLIGEYYDGENFEKLILTKNDPAIDFDWGYNVPVEGVDQSHFSIRWTGLIYAPASGEYVFEAKVDDGLRLWVNNQPLINAWGLHDASQFSNKIYLKEGQHYPIKVEYYNGMLNARIHLFWKRPDKKSLWSSTEKIPSAVFNKVELPKVEQKIETKLPEKKLVVKKEKTIQKESVKPSLPAPLPIIEVDTKTEIVKIKKELEPKFIYFVKSTNEILPSSKVTLDEWVNYLKKMPLTQLNINGYTDDLGDAVMNIDLADKRAKVVAEYLTSSGIDSKRLKSKGFGGANPVFKNPANEKERSLNRRVEIKIY
jgi:outer membrane protein OmpA-like peptidoglycan-associated protein